MRNILAILLVLAFSQPAFSAQARLRCVYQKSTNAMLGVLYAVEYGKPFECADSYYIDHANKVFGIPKSDLSIYDWEADLDGVANHIRSNNVPPGTPFAAIIPEPPPQKTQDEIQADEDAAKLKALGLSDKSIRKLIGK